MKTGFLAFMAVGLVLTAVYVWHFHKPEEQLTKALIASQQLNSHRNLSVAKTTIKAPPPPASDYLSALKDVPETDLKSRLDAFWQRCQLAKKCEHWLQQISADVSASHYQLYATYPAKQQQLQASLGQEFISSQAALSDKIERLKHKQEQVFAAMSEELFAQDYAFYDYKLKVAKIEADNIGTELSYKVSLLDQLQADMAAQQTDSAADFLSPQARYQQALAFIDHNQSVQVIAQQKAFLAQHYLPAEDAVAVIQRQQQLSQQRLQRQQYKKDFAEFQQQLNTAAEINAEGLSESQWQVLKEQKIFEFRRDYFK